MKLEVLQTALLTFKRLAEWHLKHKLEIFLQWGTILLTSEKVKKVTMEQKWTFRSEIASTMKKVKKLLFEIFSCKAQSKNIKQINHHRTMQGKNLSFLISKDIQLDPRIICNIVETK